MPAVPFARKEFRLSKSSLAQNHCKAGINRAARLAHAPPLPSSARLGTQAWHPDGRMAKPPGGQAARLPVSQPDSQKGGPELLTPWTSRARPRIGLARSRARLRELDLQDEVVIAVPVQLVDRLLGILPGVVRHEGKASGLEGDHILGQIHALQPAELREEVL